MNEIVTLFGASVGRAPWGWLLLVVVVLALIKVWPIINLQVAEARAKLRAEKRAVAADDRKRITDLEATVSKLTDASHSVQLQMVSMTAAFRLVAGELQRTDPSNPLLKQALDLVGLAATEDQGINEAMEMIAQLPATRPRRAAGG